MNNIRLERLNHTYLEEISNILLKEIKNEYLKFVTITGVKISNDLSFAKVFYTSLNEDKKKTQEELNKSSGFIRKLLAQYINLRKTPELKFIYDNTYEYATHIEELIEKVNNDK